MIIRHSNYLRRDISLIFYVALVEVVTTTSMYHSLPQNTPYTIAIRYQIYSPHTISVATSYSRSIQIRTILVSPFGDDINITYFKTRKVQIPSGSDEQYAKRSLTQMSKELLYCRLFLSMIRTQRETEPEQEQ